MKVKKGGKWVVVGARKSAATNYEREYRRALAEEGLSASLVSLWIVTTLLGAPTTIIPGDPRKFWLVLQDTLRIRSAS